MNWFAVVGVEGLAIKMQIAYIADHAVEPVAFEVFGKYLELINNASFKVITYSKACFRGVVL